VTSTRSPVAFDDGVLALTVSVGADGLARLTRLGRSRGAGAGGGSAPAAGPGSAATDDLAGAPGAGLPGDDAPEGPAVGGLPLIDVLTPGTGRSWSGSRHCQSALGARLRYQGCTGRADGPWQEYEIQLSDAPAGLAATVCYRILAGTGVVRAWARLANTGTQPLTIESVTSFLCGGLPGGTGTQGVEDLDLMWAECDWLSEGRWQRRTLREALPDTDRQAHPGADPRGCLGFTSHGSWSTARYLPTAALISRRTGECWAWQIEHNGAWHWEVGEARDGAYLALLGPTEAEHQWRQPLAPGEEFTTVPVAVAVSDGGFEGAAGALTRYRRAVRRPHRDHSHLPVIFNDYMNTLMADPTTQRLLPLISAAAAVGAEYFCIDAGWYDTGAGWWDLAGDWTPAPDRFPGGLGEVLAHIRSEGMIPGIWLEPEVTGVGTAAAAALPDEAFFHRGGVRVAEHGRYHLDLRHPAAVKYLDETVGYLVGHLGIGYLKLDYNIKADPGTDVGGTSAGAGLLGHGRALLRWLDQLLDRYPGLVIENCASGAMRADYAMLSRLQIQSTSDQQDFLRYPAIAAAAAAAMTPEQAGIWSYPQPGMGQQEIAFTLCGALLGRIHLSGHIDKMSSEERELVARAVAVYKEIRPCFATALPFWPLGLPRWTASWVAFGLRTAARSYVLVWRRGALAAGPGPGPGTEASPADPPGMSLPLPHLRGLAATAEVLFPGEEGARASWDATSGDLAVAFPQAPSACLIRLTSTQISPE
jgi:alpha-galactosidase